MTDHGPAMPFTFHQTHADAAHTEARTAKPSVTDLLAGVLPETVDELHEPTRSIDDLDGVMRVALAVPYMRHARNADALWYAPSAFRLQLERNAYGAGDLSLVNVPLTLNHDDAEEVGQVISVAQAPDDLGLLAYFQLYKDVPGEIRAAADAGCPCSIGALPLVTRMGGYMSKEVTAAHLAHLSLCVGYFMGGAFREALVDTDLARLLKRVRAVEPGPGPSETFDERVNGGR